MPKKRAGETDIGKGGPVTQQEWSFAEDRFQLLQRAPINGLHTGHLVGGNTVSAGIPAALATGDHQALQGIRHRDALANLRGEVVTGKQGTLLVVPAIVHGGAP